MLKAKSKLKLNADLLLKAKSKLKNNADVFLKAKSKLKNNTDVFLKAKSKLKNNADLFLKNSYKFKNQADLFFKLNPRVKVASLVTLSWLVMSAGAFAFSTDDISSTPRVKEENGISIDPALAKNKKTEEINDLKDQVKELQKALAQTQAQMGVPISAQATNGIPAVPSSVVTKNVPAYNALDTNNKGSSTTKQDNNITVSPGVNQIITIAIGHSNRIITPFANPQVNSTSLTEQDSVLIKDNVVYVTSSKSNPISLFITDKGNENLAISLTLLPRKIPSREVKLALTSSSYDMQIGSKEAEVWEKSQPFVNGIKNTLKEIALQNIPNGYQLSDLPRNYPIPVCSAEGFNVDFSNGQLLAGSKLHYIIGKVTNVAANPLEFKESSCGGYDIAAVALWPNNVLEPGQSSEIYIVRHTSGKVQVKQQRRSILE